jgi:hypothetical protein
MLSSGAPTKVVSEMLGHSSPTITLTITLTHCLGWQKMPGRRSVHHSLDEDLVIAIGLNSDQDTRGSSAEQSRGATSISLRALVATDPVPHFRDSRWIHTRDRIGVPASRSNEPN